MAETQATLEALRAQERQLQEQNQGLCKRVEVCVFVLGRLYAPRAPHDPVAHRPAGTTYLAPVWIARDSLDNQNCPGRFLRSSRC